jgi:hypothetical protein
LHVDDAVEKDDADAAANAAGNRDNGEGPLAVAGAAVASSSVEAVVLLLPLQLPGEALAQGATEAARGREPAAVAAVDDDEEDRHAAAAVVPPRGQEGDSTATVVAVAAADAGSERQAVAPTREQKHCSRSVAPSAAVAAEVAPSAATGVTPVVAAVDGSNKAAAAGSRSSHHR